MSGYAANGNDFDNIFEPRDAGDPAMADIGYADGGVDLSDIYAPAEVGDPAPAVNFKKDNSDIGPLFCALGIRKARFTLTAAAYTGRVGYNENISAGDDISPKFLKNQLIRILQSEDFGSGNYSLSLRLAGILSQDFFQAIICEMGTFDTAADLQSFSNFDGDSLWTWQIGSGFEVGEQPVEFLL